jgi:hypothetical protein
MAQPVWVLSVDLQTKTATFQSGMADAAKSARGAFTDIKQGAGEMSRETGNNMMEARHGVMLLGEEFGIHLPRALTSFIASIGPIGAAMEAAFPFLAIIVGATLFLEHIKKVHEEAEKLAQSQDKFQAATHNAFNALEQKTLEAGIRTDELNKNHLAALKKQLELINMQSMEELVHSFETVAKAAEVVFGDLQSHIYTFGIGSEGAKHALEQFKAQYDSLLAQGKNKEASDLLAGTRASAEHTLAMQKQVIANRAEIGKKGGGFNASDDYAAGAAAALELKKAGVGITEKEVTAQEALVKALHDQVGLEGKVAELKGLKSGNARTVTGREADGEAYKRMKAELDAEKAGQDEEDRLWQENHNKAIARLEEGEKEKIEVTEKGSTERLAAIDAAMKEENKYGLQETGFYRSLLLGRLQVLKEMSAEEARIKQEAGKEAAVHSVKMGELEIAAEREHALLLNSAHHMTAQQIAVQETQRENEDYALKMAAYAREIAALDKHGKDYENKLKTLQDREEELTRAHENKVTEIKDRAEMDRNMRTVAAITRMKEEFARGFAQVIMGHQSFAAMMSNIGDQVLTGMIQNAIMSALMMDFGKEKDAARAARKGFIWGWEHGGPAAPVLAPALGAMAFAATMAFAEGGMVPGVGRGDVVPAVLTPGEHVADKELTDGLRGLVRSGGASSNRGDVHLHFRPTYHVQTIDGDGIRATLTEHADEFQEHFQSTLRRMNR